MADETDETSGSATAQPDPQPVSATGETAGERVVLTVEDAAGLLGISPQAVRKRISKGTLPAQRVGRSWRVVLERPAGDPSATGFRETAQPRPQPVSETSATDTVPARTQAEQLAALVEPFTAPLVARVEELAREAATERTLREQAERERDALRGEVERLRETAKPGAQPEPQPVAVAAGRRPWWRFWVG